MAKTKTISKATTKLISLRLPEPLITRVDAFVSAKRQQTHNSVSFNRSMAIQELLHAALEKEGV